MGPIGLWLGATASADVCDAYGACWSSVHDAIVETTGDVRLFVSEGQYLEAPTVVSAGRAVALVGSGPVILTSVSSGVPLFDVRGSLTVTFLTLAGLRAPVIASTDGVVVVDQCVLITVDLVPDGGIVAVRGGSLDISRSTLLDGLSVGRGGQIYASDAQVTLTDSTLVGGFARSGGVLFVEATVPVDATVEGCRFEASTAVDDGGAIAVAGPVHLRVTGSRFTGLRARRGGAVASDAHPEGVVEVSGSAFEGDEASATGGALYLESGSARLDGNVLIGNRAQEGGALSLAGVLSATVVRNLVCDNTATDGGGMWLALGAGSATVTNNRWLRNHASDVGGAVHVASGVVDLSHQHLLSNEAGAGAALSIEPEARLTLAYALVASNLGAAPVRGSTSTQNRNLFFGNEGLLTGLDETDLLEDPILRAYDDSAACTSIDDTYSFYGPLRDPFAGLPDIGEPSDLDGSPADIGAYGGPGADPAAWFDADDDGQPRLLDCDDDNPGVYPTAGAANEVWYDGVDQDCDGRDTDQDGDGVDLPLDCDDQDASFYPGALETKGGGDMDCDGFDDADHDGYEPPEDCEDADPRIHPGAAEDADPLVDQDCDGVGDPLGPLVRGSCATGGPGGAAAGGWAALSLALALALRRRPFTSPGWP